MSRVLSFEPNKIPTKIKYTTGHFVYYGISVFIDRCFDLDQEEIIDQVHSKIKLAWIHDPRAISDLQNQRLNNLEKKHISKFDYIMTYDEKLLDTYPEKCIFTPDNGIWVSDDEIKIHDKTKLISMIYSFKNWTEGHILRHRVADMNIENLDLYGDGSVNPIKFKEEGLKDYQYSITIENSRAKYYYTEKLLDCFATGTVPIYWGCKNIGNYFDEKGILQFEKLEDLAGIFETISEPNNYEIMMPFIKENFNRCQKYKRYEDFIADNIYSKILNEKNIIE